MFTDHLTMKGVFTILIGASLAKAAPELGTAIQPVAEWLATLALAGGAAVAGFGRGRKSKTNS